MTTVISAGAVDKNKTYNAVYPIRPHWRRIRGHSGILQPWVSDVCIYMTSLNVHTVKDAIQRS